MIQSFCTLLSTHHDKCTVSSSSPVSPILHHLPSGNTSLFSIIKSLFFGFSLFSFVHLFLFLKVYIWVKSYGIFLSLTDLFHFTLYPPDPPSSCIQCGKWQDFIFVYGWVIVHFIYILYIISSFSIHHVFSETCSNFYPLHLFKVVSSLKCTPIKRCLTSLIIGETQIKITMRYHVTSVRMAKIKRNNKC